MVCLLLLHVTETHLSSWPVLAASLAQTIWRLLPIAKTYALQSTKKSGLTARWILPTCAQSAFFRCCSTTRKGLVWTIKQAVITIPNIRNHENGRNGEKLYVKVAGCPATYSSMSQGAMQRLTIIVNVAGCHATDSTILQGALQQTHQCCRVPCNRLVNVAGCHAKTHHISQCCRVPCNRLINVAGVPCNRLTITYNRLTNCRAVSFARRAFFVVQPNTTCFFLLPDSSRFMHKAMLILLLSFLTLASRLPLVFLAGGQADSFWTSRISWNGLSCVNTRRSVTRGWLQMCEIGAVCKFSLLCELAAFYEQASSRTSWLKAFFCVPWNSVSWQGLPSFFSFREMMDGSREKQSACLEGAGEQQEK